MGEKRSVVFLSSSISPISIHILDDDLPVTLLLYQKWVLPLKKKGEGG
jgi:hypothetical protein